MGTDRPHQKRGLKKLLASLKAGNRRVLYVEPTGAGKTRIIVRLVQRARRQKKTVLFFAHTREIVQQAAAELVKMGFAESDVGLILSGDERVRPDAPIQVASIATLSRRLKNAPKADVIIIDEAHRAMAKSYRRIAKLYSKAVLLGFTATPWRLDGNGLGDAFEDMVIGSTTPELIEDGVLAGPAVFSVRQEDLPNLKGVPVKGGDFSVSKLEKRCMGRKIVGGVVASWLKHAGNRPTVCYTVGVHHGQSQFRAFKTNKDVRARGFSVVELYGHTPLDEREAILARLAKGEKLIVVTVLVLTEGWNCPPAKCCIMVRPTRSLSLWRQVVGRFLRKYRNVRPIILDHAGNARTLGLPQSEPDWSLDGRCSGKTGGNGGKPLARYCDGCGLMNKMHAGECERCGAALVAKRRPEEIEAELVLVGPTAAEKAAALEKIRGVVKARGLSDAFAKKVYGLRLAGAA
jgi:DNA repair protein RadD